MLKWFNKQTNQESSLVEQETEETNFPEIDTSSDLSDLDYEFLFTQLLEGVAHGWHQGRILKFFQQLGERGEQDHWVTWLEKFYSKNNLSSFNESHQRLGAVILRLGEITQSATELKKLSVVSLKIGKKLFYGDITNLIWEYDGADLLSPPLLLTAQVTEPTNNTELDHNRMVEVDGETGRRGDGEKNPSSSSQIISQLSNGNNTIIEEGNSPAKTINTDNLEDNINNNPEPSHSLESKLTMADTLLPDKPETNQIESQIPESTIADTIMSEEIKKDTVESSSPEPKTTLIESITDNLELREQLSEEKVDNLPDPPPHKTVPQTPITDNLDLTNAKPELQENMTVSQNNGATPISQKIVSANVNKPKKKTTRSLNPAVIELVESWFNLGLKQASAGDFPGAVDSWNKALKLNPNLAEIWHNRGSALGRMEQYQAAIESFNRALQLAPQSHQAWNDRAHALYQMQEWEKAIASWHKAIALVPDNHQFWYNHGCALEQLKRFDEAVVSYEKALEIKPDFHPARSRYINLIADK